MPRPFLRVFALALAFSAPALASEPVTKAQALDAVRAFEANASGYVAASTTAQQAADAVAGAARTIVRYSLESDDVVGDLGPDSVTWFDAGGNLSDVMRSGERGVLVVAYLSGSVRAQLQMGKKDPNPYPGWIAMIKMYRAFKMRAGAAIPEVDALAARQVDGSLESFASAAVLRSRDSLRRTYGSNLSQPKQLVTASTRP